MLYISGAILWVSAWAVAMPHRPAWHAFAAAAVSWLGLCMWELCMRENRKAERALEIYEERRLMEALNWKE